MSCRFCNGLLRIHGFGLFLPQGHLWGGCDPWPCTKGLWQARKKCGGGFKIIRDTNLSRFRSDTPAHMVLSAPISMGGLPLQPVPPFVARAGDLGCFICDGYMSLPPTTPQHLASQTLPVPVGGSRAVLQLFELATSPNIARIPISNPAYPRMQPLTTFSA